MADKLDEYVLRTTVKVDVDEKQIESDLKKAARKEKFKSVFEFGKDASKLLKDNFDSFRDSITSHNNLLSQTFSDVFDDTDKLLSGLGKVFTGNVEGLTDLADMFLKKAGDLIGDGLDELENLLGFSKLSDSNTRSLMLGYGFSSSEAYAYSKAMGMLGFQSEEDLMYASPKEMEQFTRSFEKYSARYNELYDAGFFDSMQDFQVEMAEFKEDMTMEVVEFLMNNKDTIKLVMEKTLDFTDKVLKSLSDIIHWLDPNLEYTSSERAMARAEHINNVSSINKNTNVKIDNTFNAVSKNDQAWLVSNIQNTYEQIAQAIR